MTRISRSLRHNVLALTCLGLLGGCGLQPPGSLGLGGAPRGTASDGEVLPDEDPVLPVRRAQIEPALRGILLRVETVAPTQGWHAPALAASEPTEAGVIDFTFTALVPEGPQGIGPDRTRVLMAAAYIPNARLRNIRGFRVNGTPLPYTPR